MVGHGIRGRNVGAVAVVGGMWAVGALEVGALGLEAVRGKGDRGGGGA